LTRRQRRLLELDEITNTRRFPDLGVRPQVRERSDPGAMRDGRSVNDAVVVDEHVVADRGVDNPDSGVQLASGADDGASLEDDAWVNHGVGTDGHVGVDIGRCRVLDGDTGGHQLFVLALSHDPSDLRQFGLAVDPANFVRVIDLDGLDW